MGRASSSQLGELGEDIAEDVSVEVSDFLYGSSRCGAICWQRDVHLKVEPDSVLGPWRVSELAEDVAVGEETVVSRAGEDSSGAFPAVLQVADVDQAVVDRADARHDPSMLVVVPEAGENPQGVALWLGWMADAGLKAADHFANVGAH